MRVVEQAKLLNVDNDDDTFVISVINYRDGFAVAQLIKSFNLKQMI